VSVEDIFGGEGSQDEFGSEAFDLIKFAGTYEPEVFVSFDSNAVEGAVGSVVRLGKLEGGLDGRDSSAAFVVF